ncbi:hypothetical protein ccbrp13_62980 [Ktedonobacteria bacterium brp13]|nr:hypothetical protein ccbrp13_62980 [Ktedonobacteria bacterium brp13]
MYHLFARRELVGAYNKKRCADIGCKQESSQKVFTNDTPPFSDQAPNSFIAFAAILPENGTCIRGTIF